MDNSFWTGGADAYAKGLRKQYAEALAELRRRLTNAETDQERSTAQSEIEQKQSELGERLNGIDDAIF